MQTHVLEREQRVAQCPGQVFEFFSDAANLERVTPSWLRFRLKGPKPSQIQVGTRISYRIYWHRLPITWLSEIRDWDPPRRFTDVQLRGPYSLWHHTHTFVADGGGTRIVDDVSYKLPFGPFGQIVHHIKVRSDLESIFDYRAEAIHNIFHNGSS